MQVSVRLGAGGQSAGSAFIMAVVIVVLLALFIAIVLFIEPAPVL